MLVECNKFRFFMKLTPKQGLGSGYELTTNYRENFTKFPNIVKPTRYHPDNNPISDDPAASVQSSREIKSLYQGTSIAVGHVANYLGHIPKVMSNLRKLEHSKGHARPKQNDLLLTQRGLGCIGGYSGIFVNLLGTFLGLFCKKKYFFRA